MGNYYDENGVYHVVPMEEPIHEYPYYKGSSTKEGGNLKDISKRRKKNKNKKTHRR